jgi:hypothetical protein
VFRVIKAHWDQLVDDWIADVNLPLLVRIGRPPPFEHRYGFEIVHSSGRKLVAADNSPAHWAFTRAFEGWRYSLEDVRYQLHNCTLPLVYRQEDAHHERTYRGMLTSRDWVFGAIGWWLCHIDGVGYPIQHPAAETLQNTPIEHLTAHFRRFVAPSNMFLIPRQNHELGDAPDFILAISEFEAAQGV